MSASTAAWNAGARRAGSSRHWASLIASLLLMMACAYALELSAWWAAGARGEGAGLAPNQLGIFILAEALVLPLQDWVCRWRRRTLTWVTAAVFAASVAFVLAGGLSGRVGLIGYTIAGFSAGLIHGETVTRSLEEVAGDRGLCLAAVLASCAAAVAAQLGLSLLVGTPAGMVSGGVQAMVIVLGALRVLYPPPPGTFPIGS